MLSLEAFLSLYEDSKDRKWLDRAEAAGDFAESWIVFLADHINGKLVILNKPHVRIVAPQCWTTCACIMKDN
jgi:hypothetical protein